MKRRFSVALVVFHLILILGSATILFADTLDDYLTGFTYQERKDMKIDSKELVALLKKGEAQLIDIRFPEEFAAWSMGFAVNIPLNELPNRLGELDKSKMIVTACPHKDRAALARIYLTLKGYRVKYLKDGLLGLADLLRGDRAKDFINSTSKITSKLPAK
ncbi:MAG: rhodanese-like domain-containing protein [Candidatus Electrothrix sp. GM3_4]|nr:rhodanese-like domain-containing protein [Candidatus Electrothrix sp. GM3_4]